MNAALKKTVEYWSHLQPYMHVPHNEAEYKEMLALAEKLMEALRSSRKKENLASLLKLVAKNIEEYETHRYSAKHMTPIDMLEFLMEEHGLGQGDLPEIGSQSLVSKILSGERQLTVEHIQKLSKRFGVSPSVFIEGSFSRL